MSDERQTYQVELNYDQLIRVRIALINTAKEWEEKGDPLMSQRFRDTLKPFAFAERAASGGGGGDG